MQNRISRTLWGIVFLIIGLLMVGNEMGLFYFTIFFPGAWTFFIIIPSAIGLSIKGKRLSSMIGLTTGILLYLFFNGHFPWYMFSKLWIPYILVVMGLYMIKKGQIKPLEKLTEKETMEEENQKSEQQEYQEQTFEKYFEGYTEESIQEHTREQAEDFIQEHKEYKQEYKGTFREDYWDGCSEESKYTDETRDSEHKKSEQTSSFNRKRKSYTCVFSSQKIQYVDEIFSGAYVTSIFGNIQLDLRNAIFDKDIVIVVACIFGGIDIYLPSNIKVAINCNSILGAVDNHVIMPKDLQQEICTVFISGSCILGYVDSK